MSVNLSPTEIVTPPCRLSFPALFEPKPVARGEVKTAYQAVVLIPPDVDLAPFFSCIRHAMQEKFGKVLKLPSRANPIKDCAEKAIDGYEDGWHYVNTRTKYQPAVVDGRMQEVIDPERAYAGCWCRFHLQAYAWDHPVGGKGVSFSLSAVQLVKDGERLDGRRQVEDVFEPLDTADDEPAESAAAGGEELFG